MYKHILKALVDDLIKSESETNLVHYSPNQGLKVIEPKYHGVRGIGAEVKRTSPEHKMSFYYTEGTQPEGIVLSGAKSKYVIKLGDKKVYDIATDPEGVISAAKEKANEKSINRGVFTHDDMHHAIKSAGYHGFKNSSLGSQMGNVIAMYHPMEVTEHPIEFGKNEASDRESEKIKLNKEKPEAKKQHKFKAANWTHPNGHPRCLICGDEERTGGICEAVEKLELIIKLNNPSYHIQELHKNMPRISIPHEKSISSRPDQQVYPVSMSSGKTVRKPSGADTNYVKSKIESAHMNEKYQTFSPDVAEDSAHRVSRSLKNNGPTKGIFFPNKKGNHTALMGGDNQRGTAEHEGFHVLSQQILDKHGPEKHLKFLNELVDKIHPKVKGMVDNSLKNDQNYRNMAYSLNPRYKAVYLEEMVNAVRDLNSNPDYRNQIKAFYNVDPEGKSTMGNPFHESQYKNTDGWLKSSWKNIVNHAKNYNFDNQADTEVRPLAASEFTIQDLNKAEGKVPFQPMVQSPKHSDKVRSVAESYMKSKGQTLQHPTSKVKVDPLVGAKIAEAYGQMKHDPNHPDVKAAYGALIQETSDQYQHMLNSGLKISKMKKGMENPYRNSKDVSKDVNENNHLWYYPTSEGFGSPDSAPSDHPMLAPTKHLDSDGQPMLANDQFRVVHDFFGHVKDGHTFNHDGEENAWMSHRQMYSPLAAKALTTETKGQNSHVNFGPDGEHNRANPSQTKYAEQKAGLMPDWVNNHVHEGRINKSEEFDLQKGSLQRRLGNPKKNIKRDEAQAMSNWGASVGSRDSIPEASSEAKQRFFHKLHSQTEVRKHPKTGERLFLMHRGVGRLDDRIPHEFNITSWTPDYNIAKGFSTQDDHDDRPEVKYGKINSAWIPESAIHNYINNAANPHNRGHLREQEYIINPHKFIYAKKQKLDPSQIADSNINTRQGLKQTYGKDKAYNGENRADQEIKQFNKKLPRPKKLENPESIPAPEKLAASEKDYVKPLSQHPRDYYKDKKALDKRKIIADKERQKTGAKKPLDAALDKIKLDKAELPKAPKPLKTGDRINHTQHGAGTVRQNHNDGHYTVGFDNSKDTSLNYKGLKVHSKDFKVK